MPINEFIEMSNSQFKFNSYTMILPVYNEEARIRRVIEYYRPFARMIAVDNFSTDRTVEILKELNIETVQYKNPGTAQTPECIKFMTSLADTDYVLFLACSEFMPVTLMNLFEDTAKSGKYDVVSCVRNSYTSGKLTPLWGGGLINLDARVERFINKKRVDLDKVVIHGGVVPFEKTRVLTLSNDDRYNIVHLRDFDAFTLMKKITDYAAVEATQRHNNGSTIGGLKLIVLLFKEVLRLLRLSPSKWNRIAMREIWARMVMQSVIYWIGWELRSNETLDTSKEKSEQLWSKLVKDQFGKI